MSLRPLVPFLLASFLLAACEKPFEPRAPSDLVFSIYGHLDAAAETQWVRVMPIRESILTEPGPVDALVTLEEIESTAPTCFTTMCSPLEVWISCRLHRTRR